MPANDLADYGHLLIRRAIQRDDWVAMAIFDLAANGKKDWELKEWQTLESTLAESKLTVAEWLVYYT